MSKVLCTAIIKSINKEIFCTLIEGAFHQVRVVEMRLLK